MTRLFLSSGDVIADRRFDYARDLRLRGDGEAAADLLAQAVEIAPNFASAWFMLGDLRETELGDRDGAVDAFRRARDADPRDRHGARLRLMRLGAERLTEMPAGYVGALFDQYAPRFEQSLVGELGYRGPALLFEAVIEARASAGRPALFRRALDLGCGTGLVARTFAPIVHAIVGFDLSAQMIARAGATGLYQRLVVADLVAGLAAEAAASADLIVAADVLIYIRDVAPLMRAAARALMPGGLLAFTAETHDGEGVVLGRALRFAHAAAHLDDALRGAGLMPLRIARQSARTEDYQPVPGLVVVASKS